MNVNEPIRLDHTSSSPIVKYVNEEFMISDQKVHLSNVMINDVPAEYLKLLRDSGIGTLNQTPPVWTYKGDVFGKHHFVYEDKSWSWWKDCRKVKIIIGDEAHYLPSCLKILGLKKYIKDDRYKFSSLPFTECRIYDSEEIPRVQLGDDQTLEECGLESESPIFYVFEEKKFTKSTALQSAPIGSYHSPNDFDIFTTKMKECAMFVCKIVTSENATGFLFRPNMIITCGHVPYYDGQHATAKFFYDDEKIKGIEVNLVRIHHSPSPGKKAPNVENLDFAIFEFSTDNLSTANKKMMQELAEKAISFFWEASKFTFTLSYHEDEKQYANIIQHPDGRPKQFAFKESLIKDLSTHEIHYETKTEIGTSGAPVINDLGKLIGLHYSVCTVLERCLIDHKKVLFEELGLESCVEDQDWETGGKNKRYSFYFFPEYDKLRNLRFCLSGKDEGYCTCDESGRFFLLELIEKTGKENPRAWAADFLKRRFQMDVKKHIECNSAINIQSIVKEIEKKGLLLEPLPISTPVSEIKKIEEQGTSDKQPLNPSTIQKISSLIWMQRKTIFYGSTVLAIVTIFLCRKKISNLFERVIHKIKNG